MFTFGHRSKHHSSSWHLKWSNPNVPIPNEKNLLLRNDWNGHALLSSSQFFWQPLQTQAFEQWCWPSSDIFMLILKYKCVPCYHSLLKIVSTHLLFEDSLIPVQANEKMVTYQGFSPSPNDSHRSNASLLSNPSGSSGKTLWSYRWLVNGQMIYVKLFSG